MEKSSEKSQFRKYLLGNITANSDREKIEKKLLLDERYFEQLLAEEESLIEEFVEGELTPAEQEDFETHF